MINISTHFTLEEATFSDSAIRKGIDNSPSLSQLSNMKLAAEGMEKVRAHLGGLPIFVSSWLRVEEVNELVGGSRTSDHITGFAIDFRCDAYGSPFKVAQKLSALKDVLKYDQLIHEYGRWVHISFNPRARKMDMSIFRARDYKDGILPN